MNCNFLPALEKMVAFEVYQYCPTHSGQQRSLCCWIHIDYNNVANSRHYTLPFQTQRTKFYCFGNCVNKRLTALDVVIKEPAYLDVIKSFAATKVIQNSSIAKQVQICQAFLSSITLKLPTFEINNIVVVQSISDEVHVYKIVKILAEFCYAIPNTLQSMVYAKVIELNQMQTFQRNCLVWHKQVVELKAQDIVYCEWESIHVPLRVSNNVDIDGDISMDEKKQEIEQVVDVQAFNEIIATIGCHLLAVNMVFVFIFILFLFKNK